jgi:hypothetical protein
VCVFSVDGYTLLRTSCTHGSSSGQIQHPAALALANPKLFVLDYAFGSARVQVFE